VSPEPIVRLESIHKWFGDLHVLKGVDLDVSPKEVLVVIGPSGSGKSTLLRTINMLEEPTEGKVWFEDKELTDIRTNLDEARTHIGMVFQSFNLFPHKKAVDNVALALRKVLGLSAAEARKRALEVRPTTLPVRTPRVPEQRELKGRELTLLGVAISVFMLGSVFSDLTGIIRDPSWPGSLVLAGVLTVTVLCGLGLWWGVPRLAKRMREER
jgi:ABC-type ATPase involved in cell division